MTAAEKRIKAKAADKIYCTRLLLKYWPQLQLHCESVVINYSDVDDVEMRILLTNAFKDPEVYIASLMRGKERTQILLSHIKRSIQHWEMTCKNSYGGRIRRRIIRGLYLDEPRKTLSMIAVEENKPRGVIGKYLQSALKELSGLLFGSDGLLKTKGAMYIHTLEAMSQRPSSFKAASGEDFHAQPSNH